VSLRRAPAPLALLLAAVALAVVAWTLVLPPFQGPDEEGNFGYAQSLAEDGRRPDGRTPGVPYFSTEQRLAREFSRSGLIRGDPRLKPAWSEAAEDAWRDRDARLGDEAREDGRTSPAAGHPPVYYAFEVVPYRLGGSTSIFGRLHLMRLWSGVLMLLTTVGAWLLIGELTRRDRILQLAGAGCVGLQPMSVFMSAQVSPDAALLAAWALALWLGARVIRRGAARAEVVALVGIAAVVPFVKVAGLGLVPPIAVALAIAARRSRWRAGGVAVGATIGFVLLAVGSVAAARGVGRLGTTGADPGDVRAFASYLFQFYLPALPSQQTFEGLGDLPVWHVWLKTSWGAFGSLEVRFPDALYVALAGVTLATFGAAAAALRRRTASIDRAVLLFFCVSVAALLLGLHWVEFWSLMRGEGSTMQGRYLLPLMPIAGVAVAAALRNLRSSRRATVAAVVLGGMAALQLVSLASVMGRFYA
jgi:4-amino-4-deoxy-L-arabinose transferase-like glycosyltransferase